MHNSLSINYVSRIFVAGQAETEFKLKSTQFDSLSVFVKDQGSSKTRSLNQGKNHNADVTQRSMLPNGRGGEVQGFWVWVWYDRDIEVATDEKKKMNEDFKMQKWMAEPESWGFTAGRSEARRNGEDPSADGEGKQPISTSSHVFYTE
ncbi:unnamed protein product [Fusarium graminearum]|uniref:Chromosome 3, complete genome n=1 Tax=Gibberella zeae (strain ATCC MYA-4620 / CBS 123657 / FGSC 9075 / NRRL 31084 / PH-1) TaxID=229533 RepID=I1RMJ5_GIBZE|nr:hypothetical protein FGSG_05185 [Fusarium graminearum PH-1]ESU11116.1 hypothetical protein FGSG_05185 [Fusarium graminearum PH-1]EYB29938.1 hypothetical protein FG05_05185 [Fusarium graminearum]CEF87965.1 unnamed protein product [Fusarium graminearum]CZS83763.1 unnamed protein product [Fusarium graminearum]|eukprot:XP_011323692.1 hypothetical protein FGSG_05185 [Fusarium graminearum PH-1]